MPHAQTKAFQHVASSSATFFKEALYPEQQRAGTVRAIRRARDRRTQFFAGLFGDPAWDMLLELYAAELEQRRLSIGDLCNGSGVPGTTGLRWIDVFERRGLISKRSDPLDARRVHVSLSPDASTLMNAYFASVTNGLHVL